MKMSGQTEARIRFYLDNPDHAPDDMGVMIDLLAEAMAEVRALRIALEPFARAKCRDDGAMVSDEPLDGYLKAAKTILGE